MSTIKVTNLRHESATSDNISLTSTARVGVGTSSPSVVVEAQAAQAELQLKSTSGTNSAGLRFVPGGETNALYIYADGSRNINIDNHATSIASFRAGGGLTFNGDTAAANALDDYEEGTWTPVYNFSSSGDAQTNSVGSYVKVGSKVFIQCYIEINGTNSLSGNVLITGLPFTAANVTNRRAGFVIANAWNFPDDNNPMRLLVEPNASAIKMFNNATNATEARMTNANFTAQAGKNTIMFSGTYTV